MVFEKILKVLFVILFLVIVVTCLRSAYYAHFVHQETDQAITFLIYALVALGMGGLIAKLGVH